ncbi:hypothetical protein MOQ_004821 [Trypanosoma cruzi marinkellei]|uniref:Uncharacterized protein n=1 Tax=Trypanosoma cruzi marinkellei TaxID=85056 RepID=K2MZY2_TRYCR|nr:hypothetical protein MOQ_004821 [Trypanosoma cruzi marinkellei]
MRPGKRFTSPNSPMPFYPQSSIAVERGRQRMAGGVAASSSYAQQWRLTKSRAASSNARRAGTVGAMREQTVEQRRAASTDGRQRGNYNSIANSNPATGISSEARRVSFVKGMEFSPDGSSHALPSSRNHKSHYGSGENGHQVRHLLSELVEISHTLAEYLQGEPSALMLQQQASPINSDGGFATRPHSQKQATLKAQEIERIVKRVESHFSEKIASMEKRDKEQTAVIIELRKEIQRLQQQDRPFSPPLSSSREGDFRTSSRSAQYPTGASNGTHTVTTTNKNNNSTTTASKNANGNSPSEHVAEVENLRRMLQEEKRQRLFVEEQTQSLSEQHGRVVMTLERRLQKQEDQLCELIASLDHQSQLASSSPSAQSPPASRALPATALSSPRRLLRQQLAQHEQTRRVLDAYRRNLRGAQGLTTTTRDNLSVDNSRTDSNHGNDNAVDENNILVELGLADPKPVLRAECGIRNAAQVPAHPSLLKHSPPLTQPRQQQQAINQQPSSAARQHQQRPYDVEKVTNVIDASAVNGVAEVDDIAAFLDNITQELESIDAMENGREGGI